MPSPYFPAGTAQPTLGVASVAELRTIPSNLFTKAMFSRVFGASRAYEWDPASLVADNGATVIKPNDIGGGSPGRWVEAVLAGGGATDFVAYANVAALKAVDTTPLDDGSAASVATFDAIFVFDSTSAVAGDDVTVVAPTVGPGRWHRVSTSDKWLFQTTWFIDPNGNDENTGLTLPTAIKTWAEFARRVVGKSVKLPNAVTATIAAGTGLPDTDPSFFSCLAKSATDPIRIKGTPTTLQAGDFSAVSPLVSGTSLPLVTDAGVGFAAFVDERIRVTSGVASGATTWILAIPGVDQALTKAFSLTTVTTPFQPDLSIVLTDPAALDTYVVESLPQITLGKSSAGQGGPPTGEGVSIIFEDLDINNAGFQTELAGWSARTAFVNCRFAKSNRMTTSNCQFAYLGCFLQSMQWVNCLALVLSCAGRNDAWSSTNAQVIIGAECVLKDGNAHIDGTGFGNFFFTAVTPGALSVFDSTSTAALNLAGNRVGFNGLVWGTGNAGAGINTFFGVQMGVVGTTPTVTGAGGDVVLDGETRTYAEAAFMAGRSGSSFFLVASPETKFGVDVVEGISTAPAIIAPSVAGRARFGLADAGWTSINGKFYTDVFTARTASSPDDFQPLDGHYTFAVRDEVPSGPTTATLLSITLTAAQAAQFDAKWVAKDQSTTDAAVYRIIGGVKHTGGVAVLIGTPTVLLEEENDATWDVDVTVSGSDIQFKATGDAANDTDWELRVEFELLNPPPA